MSKSLKFISAPLESHKYQSSSLIDFSENRYPVTRYLTKIPTGVCKRVSIPMDKSLDDDVTKTVNV